MSAYERRAHRRPLHEGIRCAGCGQLAGKCPCGVFFLDPTAPLLRSGSPLLPALEALEIETDGVVEGTVSPADATGRNTGIDAEPGLQTAPLVAPVRSTPAQPARRAKHHSRRRVGALALLCLLPLALLVGGLLFFLLPAPATIAIHPSFGRRDELVTITAVTTTPTPLESQARVLISTRTSPELPIRATGVVHQPATAASGQLLFYNIAPTWQQLPAGITFNVAGGLQVISDSAVTLPPGNPPDSLGTGSAPAHVLQIGSRGNIPALTINGLCPCGNVGVRVKNPAAFSGGQDEATFTVLTQDDIERVASASRTALLGQATDGIKAQVRHTERLAEALVCTAREALDHQAGSRTIQGHITLSATCQGEVYDLQDVEARARATFRQDMHEALPKDARLAGSPVATIAHAAIADQQRGTLSLLVHVQGWWMHLLNAVQLSRRIAGKTSSEALSVLLSTPGILTASVQQRGSGLLRLPDDPQQITIQIITPQMAT